MQQVKSLRNCFQCTNWSGSSLAIRFPDQTPIERQSDQEQYCLVGFTG